MLRHPLLALLLTLVSTVLNAAPSSTDTSDQSVDSTINSLLSAGVDQAQAGQFDDAYASFLEASQLSGAQFGKRSLELARTNLAAGSVLVDTPAFAKAKRFLTHAHKSFSKQSGPEDIETAMAAFELGTYYLLRNRERSASLLLEASLPVFQRNGAYPTTLMENHVLLVNAYERMKKTSLSEMHLRAIGELIAQGKGEEFRAKPVYAVHPAIGTHVTCIGSTISLDSGAGAMPGCSIFASDARIELEFDVNEQGRVENPRILSAQGDDMQLRKALRALEKFRYAPDIVEGRAVGIQNLTYTFASSW